MKITLAKISVCLGIVFLALNSTNCDALYDKPKKGNDTDIWESIGKMFDVNEEGFLDLSGKWKFSIGDDSLWASLEYNDLSWEEIKVPEPWENEGFHGYNGYAWYRLTFDLPKELERKDLYLNLGFVDDIDQTYFNGELVGLSGGFPPYFLTAYNAFRKYYIPKEIIRRGKNLIAVRVYDLQLEGGIIKGKIGLYPTKSDSHILSELELDINLSGIWKFQTGDDLSWKKQNFNDSSWQDIFIPAFWEAQGYTKYNGFAWYRKTFTYSLDAPSANMVLLLGKIDDIDQTFLNGEYVGSIGNWDFEDVPINFNHNNEWETLRGYYVPDSIITPGEQMTLAVRVYDGYLDGGIYEGPIGFVTQEKYRQYWKKRRELNQSP
jgi:sialate O-acetylesterase